MALSATLNVPVRAPVTVGAKVTLIAQLEAGKDEEAKTTLQGIGLQSPFLEWKVFLRGLLAYYQNDDARVLENWQRLDAESVV